VVWQFSFNQVHEFSIIVLDRLLDAFLLLICCHAFLKFQLSSFVNICWISSPLSLILVFLSLSCCRLSLFFTVDTILPMLHRDYLPVWPPKYDLPPWTPFTNCSVPSDELLFSGANSLVVMIPSPSLVGKSSPYFNFCAGIFTFPHTFKLWRIWLCFKPSNSMQLFTSLGCKISSLPNKIYFGIIFTVHG